MKYIFNFLKKIISDLESTTITYISGLIIYVILYFLGLIPYVYAFVLQKTLLKNCLIIFLIYSSAFLFVLLLVVIIKKSSPKEELYNHDVFNNLAWRWKYYMGEVDDIRPFCASCDLEITPINEGGRGLAEKWCYKCSDCENGTNITSAGSHKDRVGYIQKKIEKNLRNGNWKSIVKTYK